MANMITMVVLVFCLIFALTKASMLEVSSEWRENFGWEVTCEWKLYANDSLQSVRLYRGKEQFMIYRPERDSSSRSAQSRLPDMDLHVDCYETADRTGKCTMALEIYQPIRDDLNYMCEVSGERPTFRQEDKTVNIEALVPPSKAVVKAAVSESSGRVELNCSSTGLPAPILVWTIGDQKIPQDYSNSRWNATSKLYDVWSTLAYASTDAALAVCTPEIVRGRLVKGEPAQYSSVGRIGAPNFILGVLAIFALSR